MGHKQRQFLEAVGRWSRRRQNTKGDTGISLWCGYMAKCFSSDFDLNQIDYFFKTGHMKRAFKAELFFAIDYFYDHGLDVHFDEIADKKWGK